MVIVVGNEDGDSSSNPKQGISLSTNIFGKGMRTTFFFDYG